MDRTTRQKINKKMQDMNMLVLMEIVENQDVELGQRRCVGGRGRGTEELRFKLALCG